MKTCLIKPNKEMQLFLMNKIMSHNNNNRDDFNNLFDKRKHHSPDSSRINRSNKVVIPSMIMENHSNGKQRKVNHHCSGDKMHQNKASGSSHRDFRSILKDALQIFQSYMNKIEVTSRLPFECEKRRNGLPEVVSIDNPDITIVSEKNIGLLIFTGHTRNTTDTYTDPEILLRFQFENHLLKKALLRGQPVLSICSACWRLWKHLGGVVDGISNITDQQHTNGMVTISNGQIVKNQNFEHELLLDIVHSSDICEPTQLPLPSSNVSILKSALFKKQSDQLAIINVNSMHWMAPKYELENEEKSDYFKLVDVTAVSLPDFSIEAFELRYGSPVVGCQWHPEAYVANNRREEQENLLKYMSLAGETFLLKQACLQQLLEHSKHQLHVSL
ncbi:hypothetical protein C9374_005140 [Naegleria lovaniensis]|uniref:Uncharacterized protein n=1 Tax=Naegleria lovaniensis TaxID=51637 RepID=A0AA88GR51_NAELO|nr:uncharacterized protein C9374_005140 [Naegleria lovaniensis]KAG2382560.1 hypothetical protein C9374_005140 [Naegleria lovaniensis]